MEIASVQGSCKTAAADISPPNKHVILEFLFQELTQVTYLLLSSTGSYLASAEEQRCIVGAAVVEPSIN